jgi:RND family efflux transporter MFP subunit
MNVQRTVRNIVLAVVALIVLLVAYRLLRGPAGEEEAAREATLVTVQAGIVRTATVHAYVGGYGTVAPEPAGSGRAAASQVAPAVAGVVAKVLVTEGARVAAGDALLELDDRPVRADLEKAQSGLSYAQQAMAREQALRDRGNTSERSYQEAVQQLAAATAELHSARDRLGLLRITAPVAGTVSRIYAGPGEGVDPAGPVAEIIDLDRLIISARIPAAEAEGLTSGLPVALTGPDGSALPGLGTLVFVSPVVSPADGTVPIRIRLPAHSGLSPGEVLPFRIVSGEHADRMVVPAGSVVDDPDGHSVVARISGGVARLVEVVPGFHDGDLIEVAGEHLAVGDSVVTVGAYALPSGTRVRVISPSGTPEAGPGGDGD